MPNAANTNPRSALLRPRSAWMAGPAIARLVRLRKKRKYIAHKIASTMPDGESLNFRTEGPLACDLSPFGLSAGFSAYQLSKLPARRPRTCHVSNCNTRRDRLPIAPLVEY